MSALTPEDEKFLAHLDAKAERGYYAATAAVAADLIRRLAQEVEELREGYVWYVYLIRCTDGSLYCGITTDVQARYEAHCNGTGAKYTRSHPPKKLVWWEGGHDRSSASRREYEIKSWTKAQKERFVEANMRV